MGGCSNRLPCLRPTGLRQYDTFMIILRSFLSYFYGQTNIQGNHETDAQEMELRIFDFRIVFVFRDAEILCKRKDDQKLIGENFNKQ